MSVTYPDRAQGTALGLSAYGLWGLFPLFFATLVPAGPVEILAHRVVWTLLICLIVLALMGQLRWIRQLLRRRKLAAGVATAGVLIASNWTIYTFAVLTGHVTEAALGYFLNPLVTVAMGVLILREKLRVGQWLAVGVGLVAAVYLTVDYGSPPWISLSLALSFASYGLLKKRVGTSLSALQSLSGETLFVFPAALGILLYLGLTGTGTFVTEGTGHLLLLMACGPATTVPLILFAAAARRVPLTSIGLMQFLTPVLQLLCGVLVLGETMPGSRWGGFVIVWVALAILTVDSVRNAQHSSRERRARVALEAQPPGDPQLR